MTRAWPEWRTIDSAPKDGTEILISGITTQGLRYIDVAGFFDGDWMEANEEDRDYPFRKVTHWLPLPQGPKE
jgi:hypothetical protein